VSSPRRMELFPGIQLTWLKDLRPRERRPKPLVHRKSISTGSARSPSPRRPKNPYVSPDEATHKTFGHVGDSLKTARYRPIGTPLLIWARTIWAIPPLQWGNQCSHKIAQTCPCEASSFYRISDMEAPCHPPDRAHLIRLMVLGNAEGDRFEATSRAARVNASCTWPGRWWTTPSASSARLRTFAT
jgi:hypothetical protein